MQELGNPHSLSRLSFRRKFSFLLTLCLVTVSTASGSTVNNDMRGLPFIRTYPLDEIGNIPRGLRLGFDAFGRVAVMYDGIYSVLNDSAWVNRIETAVSTKTRMTTIQVVNGKYYYGGRGSWGTVDLTNDGHFRSHPLVPDDAPEWISVTPFSEVLGTSRGVFFSEINGVVYWDSTREKNYFFELPRVSAVFRVGERVFVSCEDRILREIDSETGTIHHAQNTGLDGSIVKYAASLDSTHILLSLQDNRLVRFDGRVTEAWHPHNESQMEGKISTLAPLLNGGVAIAVTGKGIFLFSAEGLPLWTLTLPEFKHIAKMASGESGVLWVVGENAVHKIFYDSPMTSFGQQLGLTAVWPQISLWNERPIICSNRNLYRLVASGPSEPSSCELITSAPPEGTGCVASNGPHLLIGTANGVYVGEANDKFSRIVTLDNVSSMEFINSDTCVLFGNKEITAIQYSGGRWIECAPRITGVGDAPIRTFFHGAVWVEMGGDRIGRLTYRNGILEMKKIPLPWSGPQWTNVGAIGNIVVLSGALGERTFYDETKEAPCQAPELDRLLSRSPYWLMRIKEDSSGTLWATHAQGIVTFTPNEKGYTMDSATYELRNDSYPNVHFLSENSIWVAAGRSLYHVERPSPHAHRPSRAVLVSLVADHQNLELIQQTGAPNLPNQFEFDDNSLSIRLFSGSYAWRYPPLYEYRLGPSEPWTPVEPNLLLHFPKLRDGTYHLEVRPTVRDDQSPPAFGLTFGIRPPWYRTPTSYAAYGLTMLLFVFGVVRWTNHQSFHRNTALERLVQERTKQLEVTMEKLSEETRNAATLAERSRVAGEIHDSLQQSLSGAIIQLDSTMTSAPMTPEMRSRLNIVRKMLSFTREEIQHAVWNLESSLLQNSHLGEALQQLANFINSGSIELRVSVPPEPLSLDHAVKHNLLRIAQEAITNSLKHAKANRIEVTLSANPMTVVLSIKDDGIGFDNDAPQNIAGHFGLRGLRARVKSIKASLMVNSAHGMGTTIQVTVPKTTST